MRLRELRVGSGEKQGNSRHQASSRKTRNKQAANAATLETPEQGYWAGEKREEAEMEYDGDGGRDVRDGVRGNT